MHHNRYLTIENNAIRLEYNKDKRIFPIENVNSLSIVKIQKNYILNLLIGKFSRQYYLKVKLNDGTLYLDRVPSKEKKQFTREVSKIMDYIYPQRVIR